MSTLQPIDQDLFFNLSMEELRLLAKYRELATHQQRGIQQAVEMLKPSQAASLKRPGKLPRHTPMDVH